MDDQLSLRRAAGALLIGAVVAASAWSLMFFLPRGNYDSSMLIGFGLAALVWLVGLILFGAPVWAWLHRRKMRGLPHALMVGLVLSFVVSLGLQTEGFGLLSKPTVGYSSEIGDGWGITKKDGITTSYGWWVAAKGSAIVAIASAIAAAVIWRVAYYRRPFP